MQPRVIFDQIPQGPLEVERSARLEFAVRVI